MRTYRYLTTSEDPAIPIEWLDYAGAAVDLSSGTWSIKLVNVATGTVAVTKTASTITGYSSLQGTAPNQYNLLIQWATGELNITAGEYRLLVAHTVSSREKIWGGEVRVIVEAVPS